MSRRRRGFAPGGLSPARRRRMHWPTRRPRTRWLLCGLAASAVAAVAVATALHIRVVDVGPTAPSAGMNGGTASARGQTAAAAPGPPAEIQLLAAQTSNRCGLLPSTVMSYGDG